MPAEGGRMKQPHIALDESISAPCAQMPGDPKRVDVIAECLEDVKELAFNREYRSIIGTYKGMKVIGISTGMGGPSVAIGVEELKNIGVHTMMRVGSAGALQTGIDLGDLILCEGAVRDEGTSKAYVDAIYPAIADYKLMNCCADAAKDLGFRFHSGIVLSHESFYYDDDARDSLKWSKKGVLASDFETAALYTVARLRGVSAASILNNVVLWGEDTSDSIGSYQEGAQKTALGEKAEILTALEAMYRFENKL